MRIASLIASALMVCAAPAAAQDHADHHAHHVPASSAKPMPPVPPAALEQVEQVRAAIARYSDFAVAKREGWTKFGGEEPLMGEHWSPPRGLGWPDYQGPDARLDFARPSNLMYATVGGTRVLTGVAFVVRLAPGERVPEGFAGTVDRWHVHDMEHAIDAATETRPILRWLANWWLDANYRDKGDHRGRLAMVHVWAAIPNPDGMFADYNRIVPYLKHGLPPAAAEGASLDAARGLDLAANKGCEHAAGGKLWIADTSRTQTRSIERACAAAAEEVTRALAEHRAHPAVLNQTAQTAWRTFDAAWSRTLNAEQRARIAAITEHGDHAGQD